MTENDGGQTPGKPVLLSPSTVATFDVNPLESDNGGCQTKLLPRWYPRFRGRPVLYGNPEALGWLLSNTGHAVYLIGGGAFIVPALMRLATEQAGCQTEPLPGEVSFPECHNKVYGMRPSSIITTTASIISLVAAVLIPPIGALIDYTRHRRLIGKVLSIIYCAMVLPQIFISQQTWFPVLIVVLFLGLVMWTQTLVVHAYLPELTEDENELNQLTKIFSIIPFGSIILFIFVVLGIATAMGSRDDEVLTARIAAVVAFVFLSIVFFVSWVYLMEERPAAHTLREGQSLWAAGFRQIYDTSCNIYQNYSALAWFYVAVAFGDVKPIMAIAITFFTDQLKLSPTETGAAAIIMLIGSIPGAVLSSWCTKRFNPIRTSILSMVITIVFSSLAAIILKGPGQQLETYIIVAGWGIGGGFKLTATRMLASTIIPEGQDAELMGFYLFADQLLSWLPPLVYTALNEAGISQRIGLATLNIYFLIALVAYFMMGNYRAAVETAGRSTAGDVEAVLATTEADGIQVKQTSTASSEDSSSHEHATRDD